MRLPLRADFQGSENSDMIEKNSDRRSDSYAAVAKRRRTRMNEVDEYISSYPEEVRERLKIIREIIREEAPEATERICMKMPTYDYKGKWLVHFAGYEKHIGLYPQPEGIIEFKDDLKGYKTSKGTVQFPHNRELPEGLIREIVRYRVKNQ